MDILKWTQLISVLDKSVLSNFEVRNKAAVDTFAAWPTCT